MGRVTALRVRGDWQLVRIVYLPAAAVGLTPLQPCALCLFCRWWGHHLEEWISRKSLFEITDGGLRHEDGGRPVEFGWADITGVVLHRRSTIPLWRTGGRTRSGRPPFWLAISVRAASAPSGGEAQRTICIWPRQVVGGLFALMRFATELQRQLSERAARGEISDLRP